MKYMHAIGQHERLSSFNLIKSIALNRPVCFVSLVQCPFSEHISPARVRRAASGSRCSVLY